MPLDLFHWLVPWEPSITVIAITAVTAVLYVRGCARIPPSLFRQSCFWLGLLLLYLVSHTQFDYYSEHEFFMHRLQHSVLHHAGPFLIALSRPGEALTAGTPVAWRQRIVFLLNRQFIRCLVDTFNNPVIAVLLFCGLILLWLVPSIHVIAMLDWRWYRVMNWGMVINGLMFWNLALNGSLPPATRIIMMLAVIPPQIVTGMMLFAAPHELYPLYSLCGRAFDAITPLNDQQIGGFILWVHGAMMSVIGILIVMSGEWRRREITAAASAISPAIRGLPAP